VLFTALSSLLISLLLLIRERDDPFRGWQKSYADIDLTMLFELEKELPIPSEKYQKCPVFTFAGKKNPVFLKKKVSLEYFRFFKLIPFLYPRCSP